MAPMEPLASTLKSILVEIFFSLTFSLKSSFLICINIFLLSDFSFLSFWYNALALKVASKAMSEVFPLGILYFIYLPFLLMLFTCLPLEYLLILSFSFIFIIFGFILPFALNICSWPLSLLLSLSLLFSLLLSFWLLLSWLFWLSLLFSSVLSSCSSVFSSFSFSSLSSLPLSCSVSLLFSFFLNRSLYFLFYSPPHRRFRFPCSHYFQNYLSFPLFSHYLIVEVQKAFFSFYGVVLNHMLL